MMRREFDDVELLLNLWADWMNRPEPLTSGYPAKASGGFIESWIKDSDELFESADGETIQKINAAYDSLSRYYQEPICRHFGLGSRVWRFSVGATFDDAKEAIRPFLVKKGLL